MRTRTRSNTHAPNVFRLIMNRFVQLLFLLRTLIKALYKGMIAVETQTSHLCFCHSSQYFHWASRMQMNDISYQYVVMLSFTLDNSYLAKKYILLPNPSSQQQLLSEPIDTSALFSYTVKTPPRLTPSESVKYCRQLNQYVCRYVCQSAHMGTCPHLCIGQVCIKLALAWFLSTRSSLGVSEPCETQVGLSFAA